MLMHEWLSATLASSIVGGGCNIAIRESLPEAVAKREQ